jgi:hypothetical protein
VAKKLGTVAIEAIGHRVLERHDPPSFPEIGRPEAFAPGNRCVLSLTYRMLPVQAAYDRWRPSRRDFLVPGIRDGPDEKAGGGTWRATLMGRPLSSPTQ